MTMAGFFLRASCWSPPGIPAALKGVENIGQKLRATLSGSQNNWWSCHGNNVLAVSVHTNRKLEKRVATSAASRTIRRLSSGRTFRYVQRTTPSLLSLLHPLPERFPGSMHSLRCKNPGNSGHWQIRRACRTPCQSELGRPAINVDTNQKRAGLAARLFLLPT
jgi:hypothetical protein